MAHVESVRLRGFKSVGGSWLNVGFSGKLNAIVGPSGCGKSFLLDSLCFAFATPPRTFGVASLASLANSDYSEVRWRRSARGWPLLLMRPAADDGFRLPSPSCCW